MARVFVSYTHADKPFAFRLAVDLMRAGIGVWYDDWEILPGQSIVEKIEDALKVNDHLLVVLSPESVVSKWVSRELNSSLLASLSGRSIKIIPVLKAKCELPLLISDLRYADFTTSYDSGFAELLTSLGLATRVPAYTSQPRSITELDLAAADGPVRTLFPKTFADWPECFPAGETTIIVGSTRREKSDESSIFGESIVEAEILGTQWRFSRQESPGTVRDVVRVVDLAGFLARRETAQRLDNDSVLSSALCKADVSVTRDDLGKNLILIGAADTNVFFAAATVAYRQRFGYSIPARYSGDDQLYFTCDQIVSDLSSEVYPRLEESGYMHCGYIALMPNPWAPEKTMLLVSGTRATGTQAAILALLSDSDELARRGTDSQPWHFLSGNNRHNSSVPAKIVRATRASVATGNGLIAAKSDIEISPFARISQRHIVTDFEFLE